MTINRRRLLHGSAALLGGGLISAHAQDTAFPSKTITMIVNSAPGALVDHAARLYAEKMSTYLKQAVVVENMAGAGGLLGTRRVVSARSDGHTLLVTANTVVIQALLNPKAGYTTQNLVPIGEMVRSSSLLVTSSSSPFKTFQDLIAAAKKSPGQINYGSGGTGTTNHLLVEMIAAKAGVKFTHVPYKGTAPALPDVVGGRLAFVMPTATLSAELIKNGTLRPLVISSSQRSPSFPDVPTLNELGYPDSAFDIWVGMLTPAGTPKEAISRLAAAMEAARADQDLSRKLSAAGQEISAIRTPEQFAALLRADEEKFAKLIKSANIVAE